MPELAKLSVETQGDVELARVAGEVDASNVADLSQRLLDAVSNKASALVLDLRETSYIDSSGISLIFDAHLPASARSPRAASKLSGRRAVCPQSGYGRSVTSRWRARSRAFARPRTWPGTCPAR